MKETKQLIVCMKASVFRQELVSNLSRIVRSHGLDIALAMVTDDLETLIVDLEKNSNRRLYIVDTDFSLEVDGFKLSTYIRMFDVSGFILLVTEKKEVNYSKIFENKLEVLDFISRFDDAIFYDKMAENLKYINSKI